MSDERRSIGRISLWTAILGIVLPIVLAIAVTFVLPSLGHVDRESDWVYYGLCLVLFAALELISVVCGLVGRASAAGKTGIGISGTALGLAALSCVLWLTAPLSPERHPEMQWDAVDPAPPVRPLLRDVPPPPPLDPPRDMPQEPQ